MNEKLKLQLDTAIKNIESRTRSEKIIVLVMLIAGLVLSYLSVAFDPLRADIARLDSQVNNVERQIQAQRTSYDAKLMASQEDPTRFVNARLQVVARELQQLDGEISNLAGDLISPNEMTRILTSVLNRFSGLELVRFQNTAAEPLRAGVSNMAQILASRAAINLDDGTEIDVDGQVYEHGLTLEFQGDFFTTLKYLRFLEGISGNFFWDSITFRQLEWPRANVTLEIHTLSTDEGFIGV